MDLLPKETKKRTTVQRKRFENETIIKKRKISHFLKKFMVWIRFTNMNYPLLFAEFNTSTFIFNKKNNMFLKNRRAGFLGVFKCM